MTSILASLGRCVRTVGLVAAICALASTGCASFTDKKKAAFNLSPPACEQEIYKVYRGHDGYYWNASRYDALATCNQSQPASRDVYTKLAREERACEESDCRGEDRRAQRNERIIASAMNSVSGTGTGAVSATSPARPARERVSPDFVPDSSAATTKPDRKPTHTASTARRPTAGHCISEGKGADGNVIISNVCGKPVEFQWCINNASSRWACPGAAGAATIRDKPYVIYESSRNSGMLLYAACISPDIPSGWSKLRLGGHECR